MGRAEARPYRPRAGRVCARGSKSGHDMSCPYRFRASGVSRGLWRRDRKEGQHIGPFRFALRKVAKNLGKF